MKFKKAFTLAEVLITLLIIGVVASLIIPQLINNINNEEYVTAAKKAKATLCQAAELIKIENGGTFVNTFSSTSDMVNKFAEKLSYTAKCTSSTNDGTCWHLDNTVIKNLDGKVWGNSSPSVAQGIKLNDGSLISFYFYNNNCNSNYFSINATDSNNSFNYVCAEVEVDVNGFKLPNQVGRDIFGLVLSAKGIKAIGEMGSHYGKSEGWTRCTPGNGYVDNGASCLARIFEEGGMNY